MKKELVCCGGREACMRVFRILLWYGIIFALIAQAPGCIQVPPTIGANAKNSLSDPEGYPFATEVYGEKNRDTVVVIHGGPGGDYRYLLPLKELSKDYRIVFYDQRGSGLSPRQDEAPYSMELHLNDLRSIVLQFRKKSRKVILFGHSWGGMLATAYLSRHPEEIDGAVIVEPGILTDESAGAFVKQLDETRSFWSNLSMLPVVVRALFVADEDGHGVMDYAMTEILNSGEGKPYNCEGESLPEGSFVRAGYDAFNRTMGPIMEDPDRFPEHLVARAFAYKGNLALISSECSFIGYDYQERHHRALFPPSAAHILIKNAGHNFITTQPQRGLELIRSVLRSM